MQRGWCLRAHPPPLQAQSSERTGLGRSLQVEGLDPRGAAAGRGQRTQWTLGSPGAGALTDADTTRLFPRVPEPEAAPVAEESERRSRSCRLQYQRAGVRFLVPFAAHPLDGGHRLSHLLGPDWLLDVSHLVVPHARVQDVRVASLERGHVLVGREPGVTSIEVSRPPEKN